MRVKIGKAENKLVEQIVNAYATNERNRDHNRRNNRIKPMYEHSKNFAQTYKQRETRVKQRKERKIAQPRAHIGAALKQTH